MTSGRVKRNGSLAFILFFAVFATQVNAAGQSEAHVFGNPDVWQWPPSRSYHVQNYKLTLHFDELKGEVFGDEVITLRPFEAHFQKFYLNSSELTIDSVALEQDASKLTTLAYVREDPRLWITLDREYDSSRSLNVRIAYHGFPRTGLFFTNPSPDYPKRPQEVYSQGETEFNHYWFPCWDYPNDMSTSETVTTVPEGLIVVSNGKLVSVTHGAGQATYDWVESFPHSSYLISLAVGPWRKITDHYHDQPVDYYVPDYVDEATARRTFHLTPDMIEFFSRATGLEYPYEKYAQTTAHNFIFGGQENVSATTLTEWTLHNERAEQDYPSTILVSHELGQHWFGDYVQGRDWANIWLNEGFATYMEALYTQHQAGYDAYRLAIHDDQQDEQAQDRNEYRRPLVDRHYTDPMQMLDATTHVKGADVLDMLRYIIDGSEAATKPASQDEPLFRALRSYLVSHHTQTADTYDLINTLQASTGQELGWFFREWVFMAGHPDYRVEASYEPGRKVEKLIVSQTQKAGAITPIFDMPIEVAFYGAHGEHSQVQIRDNQSQQEFEIPLDFEPLWVDVDPNGFIDKTLQFEQPVNAVIAQSEKDPAMLIRLWATQQLGTMPNADPDIRTAALAHILQADEFYAVRAAAAASLGSIAIDQAKVALVAALPQPDSRVRSAVITALGHFHNDAAIYDAFVTALNADSSYAVQAAAAAQLGTSRNPRAFEALKAKTVTNPEVHVMAAVLKALAATKDPGAAEILFSFARPGVPERVRLYALSAVAGLKGTIGQSQQPQLAEVVGAALHDSFFLIQATGEELVGNLGLVQFKSEIEKATQNAPTIIEREPAQQALDQLNHLSR